MSFNKFIEQVNQWGRERIPFLFAIDFEMKKPLIWKLSDVDPGKVLYDFNGVTNSPPISLNKQTPSLKSFPKSVDSYRWKFEFVKKHLEYGDSFLTNLTVRSEIQLTHSLRELFYLSKAKYKFLLDDEFLVFSPEIFVRIQDDRIYSYPMKGTIDAAIPNAKQRILHDEKELAEHVTIVDLIRNDLSMVAENVQVSRFRYIDKIETNGKTLLQVSSEVVGFLNQKGFGTLGNIIAQLLPAGSVTGAPKPKTIEIIRQAEDGDRGYYTGITGIFDGNKFDSGVMIRFIEKDNDKYFYRSGGGLTTKSVMETEYQEVLDKIYVPVH
jgi:para-aminobenzoate synthetase component I